MNQSVSFRTLINFYCESALLGFPTGGQYFPVEGSNKLRFVKTNGSRKYEDTYGLISKGLYTAGETNVYEGDRVVLTLQYGGFYQDEALECLKLALFRAYADGIFLGGRGINSFCMNQYHYINRMQQIDVDHFRGLEEIYLTGPNTVRLGYHTYQGWIAA